MLSPTLNQAPVLRCARDHQWGTVRQRCGSALSEHGTTLDGDHDHSVGGDLSAERCCIAEQLFAGPHIAHRQLGELTNFVGIFSVGGDPLEVFFERWKVAVNEQQFHPHIVVRVEPAKTTAASLRDGTRCPNRGVVAVFPDTSFAG